MRLRALWWSLVSVAGAAACGGSDATGPGNSVTAAVFAGNAQTGLVGYATNQRPVVKVTRAGGAAAANVSVTFTVTGGGGSVAGSATVATDLAGLAQVGWVLGPAAGANTLTALPAGGAPVTFAATGVTAGFSIQIQNAGPPLSPAVQTAFDSARTKWQRIIYGALTPVANFSSAAGDCGSGTPAVGPTTIPNVLILVRFDSIDGPGKILGQSGPCYVRNGSDHKTVLGAMLFDTADVATLISLGRINDVITHEMGHVLGFGTLWDSTTYGCLHLPAAAGTFPDTYYGCAQALAMFDSIGGTHYTGGNKVPLENCQGITGCGAGTSNSHWRESTFFSELMTGYLNSGVANPLSVLTVASMADLGYTVNFAGADPYTRTFSVPPAALRAGGAGAADLMLGDDVLRLPVRVVDTRGQVVRVIQP